MEYKIYNSSLIQDNLSAFIKNCGILHTHIKEIVNVEETTWSYLNYNIFSLSSTSILFYSLFKELNYHIRSYIGDNRPLWLQSWLNYHYYKEVESSLRFHGHHTDYHGYISIEPHKTKTIFKKGFEIINTPGQIYLGPGSPAGNSDDYNHYVKVIEPYNTPRITIGFNIGTIVDNKVGNPSWIPLL